MSRLVRLVVGATLLLAAFAAAHPTPEEENTTPEVAEVEEMEAVTEAVAEAAASPSSTRAPVVDNHGFSNVITNGVSHLNETVRNEPACLKSGGTCLPQIECPPGNLSAEKGLCPTQQALGVECCHGLSLLETRCRNRGGECTNAATCSRALVEDRAEDCPEDKVCCVLVRF